MEALHQHEELFTRGGPGMKVNNSLCPFQMLAAYHQNYYARLVKSSFFSSGIA